MRPRCSAAADAVACRHNYGSAAGRVHVRRALGEGLWESVGHVVHINHMHVRAASARILVAAYAFVVLVWSSTYLANLVRTSRCSSLKYADMVQDADTGTRTWILLKPLRWAKAQRDRLAWCNTAWQTGQ